MPFGYFTAIAVADQDGTLAISCSLEGTKFFQLGSAAPTASSATESAIMKIPAAFPTCRSSFTNGATAQAKFVLSDLFSGS